LTRAIGFDVMWSLSNAYVNSAFWVLGRVDEALRLADRALPMPSRQRMLLRWGKCSI